MINRQLRALCATFRIHGDMSSQENQSKVSGLNRKLKQTEIDFMKLIEEQNVQRVLKLKQTRKNNIITGLLIGSAVVGIYGYSMFAVQQEKFLDDFDEPAKEEIKQ